MASSSQAAVTPAGIRDGDPAAFAALVERRANAVLAYCEAVLPPVEAERAAAEAFARFRAAVATATTPRALDPEALLLSATRHATAALTPPPATVPPAGGLLRRRLPGGSGASEVCALVPDLVAARADGALGDLDGERLARHLERHEACRSRAAAADRAEVAYTTPPERTVPIGALAEIMLALAAAAPITAEPGAELEYVEVAAAPEAVEAPQGGAPPDEPDPSDELPDPSDELPDPATSDAAADVLDDQAPEGSTLVLATLPPRGVPHPRPPRRSLSLPGPGGDHGPIYRFVLPGVLIAVALLAAMGVAGVFAQDRPSARPAPLAPTTLATPQADAPPVVTVAPAPEAAPARRRAAQAEERRRRALAAAVLRAAADERRTSTASPPAGRTTTAPPAARVPGTAAPPPSTSPAPPRRTTPRPTAAEPPPTAQGPSKPPTTTSTVQQPPPAQSPPSPLPGTEIVPPAPVAPGVVGGTPTPTPVP